MSSRYYIKSKIKDLYFDEYDAIGNPKFTKDINKAWRFITEDMAQDERELARIDYCDVVLI